MSETTVVFGLHAVRTLLQQRPEHASLLVLQKGRDDARSTELPKVLGGLGIAIISTSSGLLTDRQAAKKKVGGEVLAYVW